MAVKVFPANWKHKFSAEKDIYELPLMRHGGIVHFLGTARKPRGDGWLIVLQLAENVSCEPSLSKKTAEWSDGPRYRGDRKSSDCVPPINLHTTEPFKDSPNPEFMIFFPTN